jgi:hypothetical protein
MLPFIELARARAAVASQFLDLAYMKEFIP